MDCLQCGYPSYQTQLEIELHVLEDENIMVKLDWLHNKINMQKIPEPLKTCNVYSVDSKATKPNLETALVSSIKI